MTVKFSNSANPRTLLQIAASAATVLPNADWTLAIAITLDGSLATGNQYLFSGGGYGAAGALSLLFNPPGSEPHVFLEGTGPSLSCKFTMTAGATYIFVMQRLSGVLRTKVCPQLAAMPTTGAAVLTSATSLALTKELSLPGFSGYLNFGDRTADRPADQSLSRAFVVHEALSDLDIAKLAHGMQITDLGKTPAWHVRMNDGSDTADLGPNALTTARSFSPLPTGTNPNWAYTTSNRPPTVAAPTIEGSPLVGSASVATLGSIDASPGATLAYQWLVDGVAGTGAGATTLSYTPASADLNKALTFRVTATNSEGSATGTSAAKTIGAAVVAVDVTPPIDNSIFQRVAGARAVPFSMTYSGEQPAKIEYRLTDPDGTTERKAWADIGATINAGGTATASPSIPQGAKKYRIQVRSLRANASVISTSSVHANRFGVGDLLGNIGSSSAESWAAGNSTGVFDAELASQHRYGAWQTSERTHATRMATYIAQQLGVVVGIVAAGVGGTSIIDWAKTNRLSCWSNFADTMTVLGGKLAGVFISVGSNDAAGGGLVSQADHLVNIQLLIDKCRTATAQATLPILVSGFNRRLAYSSGIITAEQYETQANWCRSAENESGDLANVYHVQALQFEMSNDNVHLTGPGYVGLTAAMGYVWVEAMQGRYKRGPKVSAFTFSGADLFIDVTHRSGTDLSPATAATGITVTDASGTPALVSTARVSATRYRATFDRPLVAPVVARHLSGGAPGWTAPIMDNGTFPLPLHVETKMATVEGAVTEPPAPDTTAPVMTGSITVANVTTSGVLLSWPAATDAVGVVGYEYSINGGTSYINVDTARSVTVSGRPAGTAHQIRVRAFDAAGNRAAPLSGSFTTQAEQPPAQGQVIATKIAASRKVVFPGGTRVVAFGSQPSVRMPNAPYLEAGKWLSEKHPLDERYWVADITIDLAERDTAATSVVAVVAGVVVLEQPVIQGALIPVKLGGFNAAVGAANFCTFRITCANSERFDRTIWFTQQVGAWPLNKDADDESYFVGDIGNDLADSNTTASAVLALPVGVTVLVPAVIQGSLILVKLGGMDTLPAGVNYCDLRIDCANTERFYRTIQFNRVDN